MPFKTPGIFVKQYQYPTNLLHTSNPSAWFSKQVSFSLLVALCSTAVLVGCQSNSSTSNTPATPSSTVGLNNIKKAETALQVLYSKQSGVAIESVKCPENANLKTGGTFECQAQAQGVNFGIQVKMENDQGKFDSQTSGLLILTKIEELLKKSIKEKAQIDVTADCGSKKLRVAKSGDTFKCQVKDTKGQVKEATVTVKDENGNISVKL
jgi:Domain of unknown function (DUF4333)